MEKLIIITGTPGTGKSTLAKYLGEKTDAEVVGANEIAKGTCAIEAFVVIAWVIFFVSPSIAESALFNSAASLPILAILWRISHLRLSQVCPTLLIAP